eukprot:319735-Alexandrium_andersonii.AAC.1
MGSERTSPRRRMAVLKTFQHLTHASTSGGPGSSCRNQVPEATLKEKATWLSLSSALLLRGPRREKSTCREGAGADELVDCGQLLA